MKREDVIKRWEGIIPAVFKAEDKLRPKLQAVLKKYEDDPTTGAEEYVHMIAVEIVSGMTDEDLAKLDQNE